MLPETRRSGPQAGNAIGRNDFLGPDGWNTELGMEVTEDNRHSGGCGLADEAP